MKQKLALACTLIHEPRVILLDEPTTGVDPVSRREFWKLLAEFLQQGITILVSTPYLDEAERCHRVALLHEGRLLALDTPDALRAQLPGAHGRGHRGRSGARDPDPHAAARTSSTCTCSASAVHVRLAGRRSVRRPPIGARAGARRTPASR